jgi:hypothetical protein
MAGLAYLERGDHLFGIVEVLTGILLVGLDFLGERGRIVLAVLRHLLCDFGL